MLVLKKSERLEYRVTEMIQPSDSLTIEGKTIHKTRLGEEAHIISDWFLDKGDYVIVTLNPVSLNNIH